MNSYLVENLVLKFKLFVHESNEVFVKLEIQFSHVTSLSDLQKYHPIF